LAAGTAYPQTQGYVFTSNVVIIVDNYLGSGRRRRLQSQAVDPVIYATAGTRHLTMDNAFILAEGVNFSGALTGAFSGGIELVNGAAAYVFNTTFHRCRWQGNGGAISASGGSQVQLGR